MKADEVLRYRKLVDRCRDRADVEEAVDLAKAVVLRERADDLEEALDRL